MSIESNSLFCFLIINLELYFIISFTQMVLRKKKVLQKLQLCYYKEMGRGWGCGFKIYIKWVCNLSIKKRGNGFLKSVTFEDVIPSNLVYSYLISRATIWPPWPTSYAIMQIYNFCQRCYFWRLCCLVLRFTSFFYMLKCFIPGTAFITLFGHSLLCRS